MIYFTYPLLHAVFFQDSVGANNVNRLQNMYTVYYLYQNNNGTCRYMFNFTTKANIVKVFPKYSTYK